MAHANAIKQISIPSISSSLTPILPYLTMRLSGGKVDSFRATLTKSRFVYKEWGYRTLLLCGEDSSHAMNALPASPQ